MGGFAWINSAIFLQSAVDFLLSVLFGFCSTKTDVCVCVCDSGYAALSRQRGMFGLKKMGEEEGRES